MKLASYAIADAIERRDWLGAARCLADHFGITGSLPPLEQIKLKVDCNKDNVCCMSVSVGHRIYYWEEGGCFEGGLLRYPREVPSIFIECRNENT